MQTLHDMELLQRAHDDAVAEANCAAVAIAELVAEGHRPGKEDIDRYRVARLGVESTRRDLEYCLQIEFNELNMKF